MREFEYPFHLLHSLLYSIVIIVSNIVGVAFIAGL
jgi:hypothetical protein